MLEVEKHAVERYLNGIYFQLQDELAMVKIHSVGDASQYVLKGEENCNIKKRKISD